MPAGRPSTYTPEIAAFICQRIANGESARKICADEDMPALASIFNWIAAHPEFLEQYTRARETQMEAMAQEIIDIADDGRNDLIEQDLGYGVIVQKVDQEHIQRSRLRVDTRKWLMSKLAPKKYGDKLAHTGPDGGPQVFEVRTKSILE
jgi:hypothetical protein